MDTTSTKKKVLLVEDDTNLGLLLQEYLNHKNFSVDLKRNGEEGWQAYNKSDYDIILLDVMMPKKDGFTLAEDIRSQNTEVPIIFLTAKSLKEDKIKGLTLGADDYITKPFSMEVLELKMLGSPHWITKTRSFIFRAKAHHSPPKRTNYCVYFSSAKTTYLSVKPH